MSCPRFVLVLVGAACVSAQTPAPSQPPAIPPARVVITPVNPATTSSVPPDKVVLTIGEQRMTAGEFEQLIDALPEQVRVAARGPNKRQFAEQLVRIKILSQEARKRKLDETPLVQQQIELQKDTLLANALFADMTANVKVDEATERQYYGEHKSEYETVHTRHILIRMKGSPLTQRAGKQELTEEEALAKAQELRKKLLAGGDFAALAKTESDDATSGANGGDLGSFKHGQMVAEFDQAAFGLPVGQVSEPVKTRYGYHLIKVEQHDTKTFDEVKSDLEKKMRPELARSAVENLRRQTPVILDDGFFGPAPVPPQLAK
jgi:peptidyl-prolyl cis-trans isomerase C